MQSNVSRALSIKTAIVLITLLTTVSFTYFYFRDFLKIDICLDDGGAWDGKRRTCQIDIEREISNHLWTNKTDGLKINVPETNTVAILNDAATFENTVYFKGDYPRQFSADIIEKGSVFYDSRKIAIISKVEAHHSRFYYATTFIVSNQGSGLFTYVGLFVYDKALQKSTHLDSYLLGDRIKEVTINDDIQAINISFLQNKNSASFSEYPTEREKIQLLIVGEPENFQFHQGMHPDWDQNQDGINDCEFDGSCDHTFDYTQSKKRVEK